MQNNQRAVLRSGAACLALLLAATPALASPTETVLYSFTGPDGAHPLGGVILSKTSKPGAPVILGTTYSGGTNNGTVFSLAGTTLTTLLNFGSHGKFPQATVTEATDGTLYGTLSSGLDGNDHEQGDGAVFSLATHGRYTTIAPFGRTGGSRPVAPVTIDAANNVIGTTQSGGESGFQGTVFSIAPTGTLTTLVDFTHTGCLGPVAGVTIDAAGNLFGTTWMNTFSPKGCLWRYGADKSFTVLHKFTGEKNGGREPRAAVTLGANGLLYSTAYYSAHNGPGTLYSIAPTGAETVLHRFACGNDGGYPSGDLLLVKGVLYGTTSACGVQGGGTVFSYDTASGAYTTIYTFLWQTTPDGREPLGKIAMDAQGNIYGATEYGGADDLGVVFKITP